MLSEFYEKIFSTRISPHKRSVSDFATTQGGMRFATSVGGALLGRGADFIVIDDPLKPDEALSDVQRGNANNWFDHTVLSRLNNKLQGRIILIMQRLHEDDLTGHLLQQGGWKLLRLPAIAEEEERFVAESRFGVSTFSRKVGEALHPDREPTEVLETLRKAQGEYTFAGQYQQAPAPLGGGLVKRAWFRTYTPDEVPGKFELIFQSWDTASKASELSDYSACVTVGLKERRLYVLDVFRKRMEYPELKREVHSQAQKYSPKTILIEDKSSGTPLIQELIQERVYAAQRYTPAMDKIMRLHSVTSIIENGFLYLPEKAEWLAAYLHEMTTFPNGRNDDQADATSQALDWVRERWREPAIITFTRMECERMGFRTPNR
jgi:predicted phage terminase large subunit-like protein